MFAVCLAISIFTQFSPQFLWDLSVHGSAQAASTEVSVEFERLNGIRIGAPVIVDGQLIGSVSAIQKVKSDEIKTGLANRDEAYQISLKVAPHHRMLLRQGTIALIKSPISAAQVRPQAVIELLLPERTAPVLAAGQMIAGYSSFEEFWSADLSSRGVNDEDFRVS